jgi:hypothetical protein
LLDRNFKADGPVPALEATVFHLSHAAAAIIAAGPSAAREGSISLATAAGHNVAPSTT